MAERKKKYLKVFFAYFLFKLKINFVLLNIRLPVHLTLQNQKQVLKLLIWTQAAMDF